MSPSRQLHAIVTGRVQGVYFRASTRDRADSLDLSGWVRNRPDGSVEVLAEGPEGSLRDLLTFLGQGPSGARVEHVDARWAEPSGQASPFEIRG
jgi:acylphosphatase